MGELAVYYRVSSDVQADNNSVQAQRFAIQATFAALGLDYAGAVEYVDDGFSGGTSDRPAYQALMARIEAGEVDRLYVYAMDRLGRDADERSRFVRLCLTHSVQINENGKLVDPSTPIGMLLERLMAAFAEYQRADIKARTRAGIKALRARGEKWGGGRVLDPRRNGCAKLTDKQRGEIRESKAANKALAHTYGVHRNTITKIRRGRDGSDAACA